MDFAAVRRSLTAIPLACLVTSTGYAAPSTITDSNSVITFDPTSQSGLSDWTVDGVDHLSHQFFWYRINGVDSQEFSFDTLTFNGATPVGSDRVELNYSRAGYFDVVVDMNLNGGGVGSGVSNLVQTVTFTKNASYGPGDIDLTFFQYSNFDLAGSIGGDSVTLSQSFVFQRDGFTDFQESVVASNPLPSRGEAGEASTILAKLTDSSVDDLVTDFSVLPFAVANGAADAAYAWQWDVQLNANPVILKNQSVDGEPLGIGVIPEPTALLTWVGLTAATVVRRR